MKKETHRNLALPQSRDRWKPFLTAALLCLFTLMILFGLRTGEGTVVWEKASSICLECIGIK